MTFRTIPFVLLAATTMARGQTGPYTVESGVRVSTGSVPEITRTASGYRIYFCAQGIQSATSTDGLTFTVEPGVRVPAGTGQELIVCDPSIVKLPSGQIRMYYKGADGSGGPGQSNHRIFSAISNDGVTFTKEGLRFENMGSPDYGWTSVPDAVLMQDGRVRIFYTGGLGIESAISQDGLSFTWEPGARLSNAVDPDITQRSDGSFLLFYAQGPVPPVGIGLATSTDGLTFASSGLVLSSASPTLDPSAIRLPSGRFRIYYGDISTTPSRTLSAISPPRLLPRISN